MEEYQEWFSEFKKGDVCKVLETRPVAYFSAEYALDPSLPTYAGGLGILAGDYIREAGRQNFPLLALGLYYKRGQANVATDLHKNVTLLRDANNERVLVSLPIHTRVVYAQAWQWSEGKASVFLLDTDIPENDISDRGITDELYTENREFRLKQELLLGIGGFRLLSKLGYHPSVYHLNEGHSAFLAFELIHHEMQHQHVDFHTACAFAKKHILFTNHTLVAAGQEQFGTEMVSALLARYAEEMEVAVQDIVGLGMIENSNIFSMTILSLRLSQKSNGVSALHGEKAREVWPGFPMETVTNGIYLPRWDMVKNDAIFPKLHKENKEKLLSFINKRTGRAWDRDTLLIGWARRLVPYKRPLAFLSDIEKIKTLAGNTDRSFRIVFSGPTGAEHENDNETFVALQKKVAELGDYAVFLPNYNVELAEDLVSGTNIWLNTPVVGSEACGTSGMKALLNGSLPLSTRDGWVAEIDMKNCGWVVDDGGIDEQLITLMQNEILPLYYTNRDSWKERMALGRALIKKQFGTDRMLKEYIEKLYLPILEEKHEHKFA